MQTRVVLAFLVACGGGASQTPDAAVPAAPTYSLDPSFGELGTVEIAIPAATGVSGVTLIQASDGFVLASRAFTEFGDIVVCRITDAGSLDLTFGGGCVMHALTGWPALVVDGPDVLVASASHLNDPVAGPALFRVRRDGTLDPSFGVRGAMPLSPPAGLRLPFVDRVVALADGSYMVGGGEHASFQTRWVQHVAGTTVEPALLVTAPIMVAADDGIAFLESHVATTEECPSTPCGAGEICRFAACTPTPPECSGSCVEGRCLWEVGECLPVNIDPFGTNVTRMSSALEVIERTRLGGVEVRQAFPLPDGQVIVDGDGGLLRMTAQGTRDLSFAEGGVVPINDIAAVSRRGEGLVMATWSPVERPRLVELNGTEITRVQVATEPAVEVISAVHVLSDSVLLTAGSRNRHMVVQRWIRAEP